MLISPPPNWRSAELALEGASERRRGSEARRLSDELYRPIGVPKGIGCDAQAPLREVLHRRHARALHKVIRQGGPGDADRPCKRLQGPRCAGATVYQRKPMADVTVSQAAEPTLLPRQ